MYHIYSLYILCIHHFIAVITVYSTQILDLGLYPSVLQSSHVDTTLHSSVMCSTRTREIHSGAS